MFPSPSTPGGTAWNFPDGFSQEFPKISGLQSFLIIHLLVNMLDALLIYVYLKTYKLYTMVPIYLYIIKHIQK